MDGKQVKGVSIQVRNELKAELGTYWWTPGQEQNKRWYAPVVPDLSSVNLPPTLKLINSELLAPNTQARWALEAIQQGQSYENNPKLVPFHMLNSEDQEDVCRSSLLSFKVLLYEGFEIEFPESAINVAMELKEKHFPSNVDAPYSSANMPEPVDVEMVLVTKALKALAYPVAHYQHEDWALQRLNKGWQFGPERDNELKLHTMLKPTEYLTGQEISYDLIFALYAVRLIILLGGKVFVGQRYPKEEQIKKLFKVS